MNFNCVFTTCEFKENDINEEQFLKHLKENHYEEMLEISIKENMPISAVEMITISNSKVFINSG
ncbi:hypothetical protein [Nitrosopumilus sp. S4]